MADLKFTADYSDLSRTVDVLIKIGKASNDTAKAFAQAGRQIVSWQQKFAAEQGRVSSALEKQYQKQQLANKSAKESASVFEEQARAIERLSLKYKPLYASSQLYSRELENLNQAHKLGVLNIQQHESALEQLNQEYANGTGRFSTWSQGAVRGFNKAGVAVQQAGYQFSDFIVQVQSGQSPFVAFSQQATQLVGIMYLLPPATLAAKVGLAGVSVSLATATAGLSIIIPLLASAAMAFSNSGSSAKDAASGTEDFESKLASARAEVKRMADDLRLLQSGFKEAFQLTFTDRIEEAKKELETARANVQKYADAMQAANFGSGVGGGGMFSNLMFWLQKSGLEAAQEKVRLAEAELIAAEGIYKLNLDSEALTNKELSDADSLLASLEQRLYVQKVTLGLSGQELQAAKNRLEMEELRRNMIEAGIQPLSEQWNLAVRMLQTIQGNAAGFDNAANSAAKMTAELKNASNVLSSILGKISSLGFSNIGAAARVRALEAGQSASQASLQGIIAEERARLAPALSPSAPDGLRSSAQRQLENFIQQQTEATRLSEREQELLASLRDSGGSGGGGGATTKTAEEYLSALMKEADYKNRLVGLSEEEARVKEIVYEAQKQGITVSEAQAQVIASVESATRKQIEAEKQREAMMNSIQNNIESAFMSMVDGSKSVLDAFKDMLRNILLEIYKQKVVTPMAEGIMGLFMAKGGAFSNGVQMFANGGVVGSPTMFGHSGGLGVMGEAGPEAIMPLKRGSDGKLGVAGGGNVTVHQTFNFAANGDDSVKRIIAQAAPQIAQMTQKQIMDSRRRGGQMKATFS